MIIKESVEQGSEEWLALRRGRPTASQFGRILTPARAELSKSRFEYMDELIAECFFPEFVEFEGNKWTDRGNELEPEAREAFGYQTKLNLWQVGFCTRDDGVVGCSPDSLIVDEHGKVVSGLEIKCPAPKKHVTYKRLGKLPNEYKAQVHGSMAVTGVDEWHFYSYAPGVQPLHLVVDRDDYTQKLTDALDEFLIEYAAARESLIPQLQAKGHPNETK